MKIVIAGAGAMGSRRLGIMLHQGGNDNFNRSMARTQLFVKMVC